MVVKSCCLGIHIIIIYKPRAVNEHQDKLDLKDPADTAATSRFGDYDPLRPTIPVVTPITGRSISMELL